MTSPRRELNRAGGSFWGDNMLTAEELAAIVREQGEKIVAVSESAKSAHKRIGEVGEIASGIHELATSVAGMAAEVNMLTKNVDNAVERIEKGQKIQGERIGNIEKAIALYQRDEKTLDEHDKRLDALEKSVLLIEQNNKTLAECEKRLDEIDKEPANKWKDLVKQVTGIIVAAVLAYILAKFT